jgi:hypothetical protein
MTDERERQVCLRQCAPRRYRPGDDLTGLEIDRSDAADARRLRWLLAGNSYGLEEWGICGHGTGEEDLGRVVIDQWIEDEENANAEPPRTVKSDPAPIGAAEIEADLAEQRRWLGIPSD